VTSGDLYPIAQRRPAAIGIVDGYFGGAPSVWHKEILWALSQGIPVFGSASMGALRAAELHIYGMQGVGRIFEAFRDGELEDDDEVALVHGPAEMDYIAASVPMVNVRATLHRAEMLGVLSQASRLRLETIAKSLFFPDRTWPAIAKAAAAQGTDPDELQRLHRWLPEGSVDQKRDDALEMLAAMQQAVAEPQVRRAGFRFEPTHYWNDLVRRRPREATPGDVAPGPASERVIEELRLEGPAAYAAAKSNALLRMLAGTEADRQGLQVSREARRAALDGMRRRLGLFSRSQLDAWMERSQIDAASFERLLAQQAALQSLSDRSGRLIDGFLVDEMRLSGAYERLADRAQEKVDSLGEQRPDDPAHSPLSGPGATQLRMWFFEDRLGRPMPDDVEAAARALGLASAAELDRALWREWMYSSVQEGDATRDKAQMSEVAS
jgi:hypothetical protein